MESISPHLSDLAVDTDYPLHCPTAPSFGSSPVSPAPLVTATAWSIINITSGECLWGKNKDAVRDIASLTKMMTLFVVKQCFRHKICTLQDMVIVPKEATLLGGTTAHLKSNDSLRVVDLLHGMMLNSGNDAAYTLADYFGGKMLRDPRINCKKTACRNVDFFIKQMNVWSRGLGMKNSKFLNPHGLSHMGNQSTAMEICKLAAVLIKRPMVLDIVSKARYSCDVWNNGCARKVSWTNTNLLLGKPGINGFKTGQTPTAGPCLCITYNMNGYKLAVTILKTRTPEKRWSEALKLIDWAVMQLKIILQKHPDRHIRMKNLGNLINTFE